MTMMRRTSPSPPKVALLALLLLFGTMPKPAFAVSPVKLQKWAGEIDFSTGGTTPFTLEGTASHLGQFTAYGEVDFIPGEEAGSLAGDGVAVFEAANGDLLVGVVSWEVDAGGDFLTSRIHF